MAAAIVVGTDGSESATRALAEATRLAKALGSHLHVVSAFEPQHGARIAGAPEGAAKIWAERPDSEVERVLGEAGAAVRLREVEVTTHARATDPVAALLEVAEEVDAEMIVVGSRGMHGARRLALGNVPNKVSHQARCNVMIVATDQT